MAGIGCCHGSDLKKKKIGGGGGLAGEINLTCCFDIDGRVF